MCAPASFVLTKDKVFWSKFTDSHESIVTEHKLHADGSRGPNVLRVEISPPGKDYTMPLDQWIWRVDQDEKPKWFDVAADEARTREALECWLVEKIILPDQHIEVLENRNILICYGSIGVMRESSQVREMRGSSQVREMWESSQVGVMRGSSRVGVMGESSQVGAMWESSQVREMWGSSQVREMGESSQVGAMWESSQVREMRESSQVGAMRGSSQVATYIKLDPAILQSPNAVLIDRSGNKPVCYVGK